MNVVIVVQAGVGIERLTTDREQERATPITVFRTVAHANSPGVGV